MGVIYTMERHHELLHLWRRQGARDLRVVHLDFHCDLRGTLIDRSAGRAFRIRDRFPALDQGNFLSHAIQEERISSIRWVHDEPGGRVFDIGTVKYETDLSALPHRLAARRRRDAGVPLDFDVLRSMEWAGVRDGEYLDIDWDYFACTEYPADSIATRIARFWDTALAATPAEVAICYSPEYSHPSRGLFSEFVAVLADRLNFTVEALTAEGNGGAASRSALRSVLPDSMYRGTRQAYHRAARAAKQRGIF